MSGNHHHHNPFYIHPPRRTSPKPTTTSGMHSSHTVPSPPYDGLHSRKYIEMLTVLSPASASKKRKASPYDEDTENYDRMSASPTASPILSIRAIGPLAPSTTQPRTVKRARTSVTGRPLPLSRLLETLDSNGLKALLKTLCDRNPQLTPEISSIAPRPSVSSSLSLLHSYEHALRQAFPYGGKQEGDYAYNRVKSTLLELLAALTDYTPHFLPPNEPSLSSSLEFLDGATSIIHRLPNWESPIHNHHKNIAYEEISKAWILVLKETAKKGGPITLQYDGWDGKLQRHNEQSAGKLEPAMVELRCVLGLLNSDGNNSSLQQTRTGNSLGFHIDAGAPVALQIW
ncbi:Tethering factor for nuclear proteasome sts1 [Orbilia brochopaga]|uniref:Tethering factor for nuclear proteasome STS1 n=1 Tax=Orbilia brochopaga TaxID=3140254 RepID=A0AAV9UGE1_9PEZI